MAANARRLAELSPEQRRAALSALSPEDLQKLEYTWEFWARPDQLPPPGDWRTWLLLGGRGSGKQVDVNEPIPTPTGWTRLGDIAIGDDVFDEAGRICQVTATYDSVPEVAYRLTFSDNTTIDACADHQWVTWTHAERKVFLRSPWEDVSRFPDNWPQWRLSRLHGRQMPRDVVEAALELAGAGMSVRQIERATGAHRNNLAKHLQAGSYVQREPRIYTDSPGPQIRTTQQIVDTLTYGARGDTNHCIPTCGALQLPEQQLPIPAWIIGYWLGNGTIGDGAVTCGSLDGVLDWPHIQEAFAGAGYDDIVVRHWPDKATQIRSRRLREDLRRARVLHGKAIPLPYLRGSVRQRTALLRGLMDSDGYADPVKSTVEFSSTDKRLADAVFELAASLGQKPVIKSKRATLYGKDCGPAHRVTWRPTIQVFSLPRKADRLAFDGAQGLRHHHRMIISAERIPPTPMRCLTVNALNSMFLVGRAFLPTHNTRSAAEWCRGEIESGRRRQMGAIGPTADSIRRVMVEGPSGLLLVCPNWNRPSYEPSTRRIVWPNGGIIHLFSAEEPDRLRGPNLDSSLQLRFSRVIPTFCQG
ncbi:MAG: LAGLIDADG family homing endonuclease [Rhodopila sp.]